MIGMVLGGMNVVGGIAGFMSGRKEKKWGRRNAAAAQGRADERLGYMDNSIEGMASERDLAETLRNEDRQRYANLGFDQNDQALAAQIQEGADVNGIADQASQRATNEYDVSMDAQRRAMMARGVRPGSAAMAALGEDAAYDRARIAAGSGNTARRQADDVNFARKVAFSNQGAQMRDSIRGQGGNIVGQHRGEFGMQGAIRGEYLSERNQQQERAMAGKDAMLNGAMAVGRGALGLAGAGAFGDTAQAAAQNYVRPA